MKDCHSYSSGWEEASNTLTMDGAKGQVVGMFWRKCREAGIWMKHTEPYTPWSNAAEAAIRKQEKGAGQQVI
jgi:hypothetical protein